MENINDNNDLLIEEMHPLFRFTQASRGERFMNYLIDNLLMRFALGYLSGMVVGGIGAAIAPEFMSNLLYGNNVMNLFLFFYAIAIFDYIIYYTLCEKLFKGQTLGKLITKTRAIRTDGEELTFKDALLRSLSRLVPLEQFSGFWNLWHDTWTKTMVVKIN